jgi:hypothetical protein
VEILYSLVVGDARPGLTVRRFHLLYGGLYGGAVRLARSLDLAVVLDSLEADLHLSLAVAARRRLFLHAGVVAWHDAALIVAGPSLSGKTTLVQALVAAGARYYSDEFAVLDARGRVHPYRKAPAVRAAATGRQQAVPIDEPPGAPRCRSLPVGLIALPTYRPAARWRPRRLSAGCGTLELLRNAAAARYRPAFALRMLTRITPHAPILKGERGDAGETAGALLRALDAARAAAPGET